MPERLDTIKCDYRNIIFIAFQQLRIALNVHFVECVLTLAACGAHRHLRVFAEMATRSGIDDDFCFHGLVLVLLL